MAKPNPSRNPSRNPNRLTISLTPGQLALLRAHPDYIPLTTGMRSGDAGTVHLLLMQALGCESTDRHNMTERERQQDRAIDLLRKEGWVH